MKRSRLIAFKIATPMLTPIIALLVIELGLRAIGFGFSTNVFIEEKDQARSNWAFTFKYFPWSMARPMAPVAFSIEKPETTTRIFVLGGSAAQGFPSADFGIASQLQLFLEEAYPNRNIEVINASVTAINSHVVLPIAKACLEYDPDFLVIYAGNNEVVGPFGPGTTLASFSQSRPFIKSLSALKSTHL